MKRGAPASSSSATCGPTSGQSTATCGMHILVELWVWDRAPRRPIDRAMSQWNQRRPAAVAR